MPSRAAASPAVGAQTPASAASPKPAPQPVAATTPATAPAAPQPAVAGQPAPKGTSVAGGAPATAARPPATASKAPLSPIDHALWVSNQAGSPATDHVPPGPDHQPNGKWVPTPGQELWASLHTPAHVIKPGEQELWDTRDDSFDDPINWSVTARKIAHVLEVYYKGRLFGSYRAVFGRNPDHMAKEWEGDLRTPEGVYVIVSKSYNSRWRRFLRLNYPNSLDRDHYETMLHQGLIPVSARGRARPLGGSIGIHGTDRPRFNRVLINWTLGCISVDNDVVLALDQLLPVGTMVLIKP